jgi:hypothetical protein
MKPIETLLTLGKDEINVLSDGIVLLDAKGTITGINQIPPHWLKRVLENRIRIAEWVADAVKGKLSLPATVELPENGLPSSNTGAAGKNASLCLNGRRGYLLIIRLNARGENPLADAVPLMGREILNQLRGTADLLRRFEPAGSESARLKRQAADLEMLLLDVAALAELRERDNVFCDDRFQLAELVRDLLPQLPHQSGGNAICYVVDADNGDMGNLYGSRHWLRQALHTLLLRLVAGCAPRGQVRIELRQIGDFQLMTGSARTSVQNAIPVRQPPRSAQRPEILKQGGLTMDICRRIIDLHGGQMKLDPVSGGAGESPGAPAAIESFTLTLPTGLPVADRSRVSCAQCRITVQAMQYARDLAEITAREADANLAAKNMRKTA